VINLLELFSPRSEDDSSLAFPREGVIDAWRSPYFDWAKTKFPGDWVDVHTITPKDADALDALARAGRVIGGMDQWAELFAPQKNTQTIQEREGEGDSLSNSTELLAPKFRGFVELIRPPDGNRSISDFVQWLDRLLGPEPQSPPADRHPGRSLYLRLSDPDGDKGEDIFQRDLQALLKLKAILRSMLRFEKEVDRNRKLSYGQFFSQLTGMIEASSYRPTMENGAGKILVTDVVHAHGLTLRTAAVLGLAEGEFPRNQVEDPFLWEGDRAQLNESEGVSLDPSIEGFERERFYQAVTRPREKLLLTRPRLADSGAEWQPSAFWEEIRRHIDIQPITLTSESVPTPHEAASNPELVASLMVNPGYQVARDVIQQESPDRLSNLGRSAHIFDHRYSRDGSVFNGYLIDWAKAFTRRFGLNYRWSPSSLERYHSCPYSFFIGRVLKLETRDEPAEGPDAAQSGTIYHQILERLYRALPPDQRTEQERLLQILPVVARQILDQAPVTQGFRETAWWRETRREIHDNIERSIVAMAEIQGDFIPLGFELHFRNEKALTVREDGNQFILQGIIDRVDRDREGRSRIIDYKTAGPYSYTKKTLENGDKIQLALYALAARDTLGQGDPADGFYWHVRHAKPSGLTLSGYGPMEAIDVAVDHAWRSVRGARQGYYVAEPPSDGCPAYCPAAGFCWNYRPGMWG
jgi:RecB family exonuclease